MWGSFDLRPILIGIFIGGALFILAIWLGIETYKHFFVEDAIISEQPIVPEIRLIIIDNQIDTLYVYKKP